MVAIPQDLLPAYSLLFGAGARLEALDLRTLKRIYRRRALETHPDRARATGADPALLTRRFQDITAAYERLSVYLHHGSRRPPAAPRASGAPRPPPAPRARPAARPHAPRPQAEHARPGRPAAEGPRTERPRAEGTRAERRRPERPAGAAEGRSAGPSRRGAASSERPAEPPRTDHFWAGRLPERDLLLGQYLYYSGRISWRALIGAIHWQRSQRPYLGQLAVRAGYLAPERVRELMSTKSFDERFGDAAVRLGYLRAEIRDALVGLQRTLQQQLGQYFLESGILRPDELSAALSAQVRHNVARAAGARASGAARR